MEIKCPVCKKSNSESTCTRCGCALEKLRTIIEISNNKIKLGKQCLIRKDGDKAHEYALLAWKLKKNANAALLGFCASCLIKNNKMAKLWLEEIIKEQF